MKLRILIVRKMADKFCYTSTFRYCRHGNICRYKQVTSICENISWIIITCEKQHLRDCFWFKKIERCKFSPCSYKHTSTQSNISTENHRNKIYAKFKLFENKIQQLESKINEIKYFIQNERKWHTNTKEHDFKCENAILLP